MKKEKLSRVRRAERFEDRWRLKKDPFKYYKSKFDSNTSPISLERSMILGLLSYHLILESTKCH